MSLKASERLDRFPRALSAPADIDATLATICYTSLLLHTQLSKSRVPSKLHACSPALRNLYNLLEDTRVYTRLTGLVTLYAAIREPWGTRQDDLVSEVLLRTSNAAVTFYQLLENIALLLQQNVLRSQRLGRWEGWLWTTSNKLWLASLLCDLARLARVRQLGFRDDSSVAEIAGDGGENHDQSASQSESAVTLQKKQWWQELLVTAASFPLAINWSFAEGESPVSEALVAGAGLLGGLVMLKDAIKDAA